MSSPPPSSDPPPIGPANGSRTLEDIESTLDRLLDPVLSLRRTALPLAQGIAPLPRAEQDFVLHWVTVAARTNIELAYQLAAAAPHALAAPNPAAAEAWIIEAMDTYDREGLHRATEVLFDPARFTRAAPDAAAVAFDDVAHVLRLFMHGLAGRPLRLDTAARSYTDTETLYLPLRIARTRTAAENFFLYKAGAVLLWAQTRYGTFHADLEKACSGYVDPARARALLNALETLRLESRIAQILPGLARDLAALRTRPPDPRCAPLLAPSATVEDSIALLAALYDSPPALEDPYHIVLEPAQAAAVKRARMAREKNELQTALAQLLEEQDAGSSAGGGDGRYSLEIVDAENEGDASYALSLDSKPVAPSPEVSRLIDSIMQDLGHVPEDYLLPHANPAGEDASLQGLRIPQEGRAFFYNEWDY